MAHGERSGRGRQAEARRNDDAVLNAARLVFAVHGPDAPVSAVAAAAGVGMGTLYRRYASKEQLLQQLCLASMAQQIAAAERAAAQTADPLGALAEFIRSCVSFRAGVFTTLAGRVPVTTELRAAARRCNHLLDFLVSRAGGAGALRSDVGSVDIHQLIELFSRRRPDHEPDYERLLNLALDGLVAPGHHPLPGAPPTWASYAQIWSEEKPVRSAG